MFIHFAKENILNDHNGLFITDYKGACTSDIIWFKVWQRDFILFISTFLRKRVYFQEAYVIKSKLIIFDNICRQSYMLCKAPVIVWQIHGAIKMIYYYYYYYNLEQCTASYTCINPRLEYRSHRKSALTYVPFNEHRYQLAVISRVTWLSRASIGSKPRFGWRQISGLPLIHLQSRCQISLRPSARFVGPSAWPWRTQSNNSSCSLSKWAATVVCLCISANFIHLAFNLINSRVKNLTLWPFSG